MSEVDQKKAQQQKANLIQIRSYMNEHIKNGMHIKAKICGVSSKTVKGKKDPNKTYDFHTLILETSLTSQKIYVNLRGDALVKNYHQMLSDVQYVGKVAMIPISVTMNEYQGRSRLDFSYYGDELIVFDSTQIH